MGDTFAFETARHKRSRSVIDVGGVKMAVLTESLVVSPAEVTREQVAEIARTCGKTREYKQDGSRYVEIELPGLMDYVVVDDLQHADQEVADALNQNGVSVIDWAPYRLG